MKLQELKLTEACCPIDSGLICKAPQGALHKSFLDDFWLRKPVLIRANGGGGMFSEEEVFQSLPRSFARITGSQEGERYVQVDDSEVSGSSALEYAARASDNNFDGYFNRISKTLKKNKKSHFSCSIGDFYCDMGIEKWQKFTRFLCPINKKFNFPFSFVSAHIFMGNNPVSFQGVHRDIFNSFCFFIKGNKSFRLWPKDYFDLPEQTKIYDYEEHKKNSILVEGRPGDILYWPREYWHVGEVQDEFAVSISLLTVPTGGLSKLNDKRLRSSSGFFKLPDLNESPLIEPDSLLVRDPCIPFLVDVEKTTTVVFSGGRSVEIETDSLVGNLIDMLESCKSVSLLDCYSDPSFEEKHLQFLEGLCSLGAVRVQGARKSG